MSERIPVTPDTAIAGWALHDLDLDRGRAQGARIIAPVLGTKGEATVVPANGIDAVGVERDGDGWVWVVR